MDIFTILHEADIRQLRDDLKRLQEKELAAWDPRKFKALAEENLELKLRVGLLVHTAADRQRRVQCGGVCKPARRTRGATSRQSASPRR